MAGFFEKINIGLGRTREKFQEQVNVLLNKGPNLDDEFWDGLEEALISSDIGAPATLEIVDNLKDESKRKALPDAYAVFDLLNQRIVEQFCEGGEKILNGEPAVLLFVGINGTGKTTTVGKIAKMATDSGRKVILGSADTFRAAAIEQLEVWSKRANVEMVTRERGSDPASVCFDTIQRAEEINADLVLIDTAGRLHTSKDLMLELEKVCKVTRKRSNIPVYLILVIDATTGQNGLTQAKEFNDYLNLDGLIVTKLDGTAKGGIALAVSKELNLPILKIGVGESIDDLRDFDASDFARAFVGDLDKRSANESNNVDSIKIENEKVKIKANTPDSNNLNSTEQKEENIQINQNNLSHLSSDYLLSKNENIEKNSQNEAILEKEENPINDSEINSYNNSLNDNKNKNKEETKSNFENNKEEKTKIKSNFVNNNEEKENETNFENKDNNKDDKKKKGFFTRLFMD